MAALARAASTRPSSTFAAFGLLALLGGLLALFLMFEGPRVALREGMNNLAPIDQNRVVYIETEPVGAALDAGGTGDGYLALKFRIGLPGKDTANRLEAAMPRFYGEMLRDFTSHPLTADAGTGRLDLPAIEGRVRGTLVALLGPGTIDTVRVIEARRRPI